MTLRPLYDLLDHRFKYDESVLVDAKNYVLDVDKWRLQQYGEKQTCAAHYLSSKGRWTECVCGSLEVGFYAKPHRVSM